MDYAKTLHDLVIELVNDKASVSVRQMPSLEDDEVLLYVYANKQDIAKLIGKKGAMASSIRQIMSVSTRLSDKRVTIKFESFED